MNFARVIPGLRYNCRLGPREQFNTISSIIDANTVYSSDPELLEKLRLVMCDVLSCKHKHELILVTGHIREAY